jgi:hypothetical protein
MSGTRQPRTRRRRGVSVVRTERDLSLLLALNRFRLARTSQLVRYGFDGVRRDTAAVRLRRLFDSKHLSVLRSGPMAENVYRLGPAGRRSLEELGTKPGSVPRGGLEHHLAVVETWVALAGASGLELARCLPDWELREEFGVGELATIPDLFALLRVGEATVPLAFEVDCGTESVGVLRSKVERYAALWGRSPGLFGWERFGLAVVLHQPVRRAAVAAALKNVWVIPCGVFGAEEPLSRVLLPLLEELQAPLSCSP